MSWWGKIVGSAFGFMLGGPIGALLGAALGHNFDRGLNSVLNDSTATVGEQERVQSAFFAATFSVMGYIAKADGQVTEDEISVARQIMSHMQLSDEQRDVAMHLFNQGKQPDFKLDDVLNQFKQECHGRRNLIQMFIEIQITTLLADRVVHRSELTILKNIGMRLGVNAAQIELLIQMVQAQQYYAHDKGGYQRAAPTSKQRIDNAYAVLGMSKDATDDEVKKAYRRLMNQHHPDKLVAKGLPEEMIKLANEKTQEIKQAYEDIKKSRGL